MTIFHSLCVLRVLCGCIFLREEMQPQRTRRTQREWTNLMKVLLQRVSSASVTVDGTVRGAIDRGLLLLVGFGQGDTVAALAPMAEKLAVMRIFPNEQGRFHFSVKDIGGGVLLIPQFTLFADTSKGRRPEFFGALPPAEATKLFDAFVEEFTKLGVSPVEKGVFGADMKVSLLNDGPVTIMVGD